MIELENCLASARPVVFAANTPRYLLRHLTGLSGVQDLSTCYTTRQLLDELLNRLNADCDLDVLTEVYVILAAFSMMDDLESSHLARVLERAGPVRWVKQIVEMIRVQGRSTSHAILKPNIQELYGDAQQSVTLAHVSRSRIQFPSSLDEESRSG